MQKEKIRRIVRQKKGWVFGLDMHLIDALAEMDISENDLTRFLARQPNGAAFWIKICEWLTERKLEKNTDNIIKFIKYNLR